VLLLLLLLLVLVLVLVLPMPNGDVTGTAPGSVAASSAACSGVRRASAMLVWSADSKWRAMSRSSAAAAGSQRTSAAAPASLSLP
jgi:hypothetical protein